MSPNLQQVHPIKQDLDQETRGWAEKDLRRETEKQSYLHPIVDKPKLRSVDLLFRLSTVGLLYNLSMVLSWVSLPFCRSVLSHSRSHARDPQLGKRLTPNARSKNLEIRWLDLGSAQVDSYVWGTCFPRTKGSPQFDWPRIIMWIPTAWIGLQACELRCESPPPVPGSAPSWWRMRSSPTRSKTCIRSRSCTWASTGATRLHRGVLVVIAPRSEGATFQGEGLESQNHGLS